MYFPLFFSFFIPIMSRIGFLKKIMQTSKQAWCLFPFSPHFHILLYKSLQPMTPRVQLHPLPSQALLFFPKELIWSCCQPAGTFHAQRMFICSGILRLHHEGGLKNQLAVTWVAGVIIAETDQCSDFRAESSTWRMNPAQQRQEHTQRGKVSPTRC